jgi:hypothetical protein
MRWYLVLLLLVVASWGLLLNTLLMDSRQGSSSQFGRMDKTLLQLVGLVFVFGGVDYGSLDALLQQHGGAPAPGLAWPGLAANVAVRVPWRLVLRLATMLCAHPGLGGSSASTS